MNPQRLVEMAEDIAANLSALPYAQAVEALVVHLQRFWEPRMRIGIVRWWRDGGAGLSPLAAEAVAELARRLDQPPPPDKPGVSDAG